MSIYDRERFIERQEMTNAKVESRGKACFDMTEAQHLGLERSDNPKTREERRKAKDKSSPFGYANSQNRAPKTYNLIFNNYIIN